MPLQDVEIKVSGKTIASQVRRLLKDCKDPCYNQYHFWGEIIYQGHIITVSSSKDFNMKC